MSDLVPEGAGAAVSLRRVRKSYGDTLVLHDVSLDIADGELISLLGPSGCGKTTLLRLIAGFIAPDAGTIAIAGRSMERVPPRRRNLGIVFQEYSLWPHMSVRANVAFGLEARGVSSAHRHDRVDRALALVGLDGFGDRPPSALSGGQKQRVAIARAIVYEPSVLLLDEPLSALDRKLREHMQAELRDLQRRLGITTILVTHDQDEALLMSDRIVVMRDGRIEQLGTARSVYETPRNGFVAGFVGKMNAVDGTFIESGGAAARVAIADGIDVEISSGAGARPRSAGARVRLMIRPERIAIAAGDASAAASAAASPPAGHPAVVEAVRYAGAVSHLDCRLTPEIVLRVALPGGAPTPPIGDAVRLVIDPEAVRILDDTDRQ